MFAFRFRGRTVGFLYLSSPSCDCWKYFTYCTSFMLFYFLVSQRYYVIFQRKKQATVNHYEFYKGDREWEKNIGDTKRKRRREGRRKEKSLFNCLNFPSLNVCSLVDFRRWFLFLKLYPNFLLSHNALSI